MLSRRNLMATGLAAGVLAITRAHATEMKDFDMASFLTAQKAGRPIFIGIHASWCPICRAQKPILSELMADPKFGGLVYYVIDFDTQKDAVRHFDARMQSTLIAFKGAREQGRSVGDRNRETIATLLNSVL